MLYYERNYVVGTAKSNEIIKYAVMHLHSKKPQLEKKNTNKKKISKINFYKKFI